MESPKAIPVSALTGEGCDELLENVLQALPAASPLFPEDYITDQPERMLAAEWIREALLRRTWQELPHAIAVMVERWNEREDGLLEIEASIVVERESQKAIVIGKGGCVLKQVGTQAREELERTLGTKIFLKLWVKVRRDWRNDERALREFGIES